MKRLVLLVFAMAALCAHAQTFIVDGIEYIYQAEGKVWVYGPASGYENVRELVIPDTVATPEALRRNSGTWYKPIYTTVANPGDKFAVKGIESSAFKGCDSLVSVKLPTTLTTISGGAFQKCTSLRSVSIPSTVDSIAEGAFAPCSHRMMTFEVDPNNETFVSESGSLVNKVSHTLLHGAIRSYYPGGAQPNTALFVEAVIPNGVTKIGDYAFSDIPYYATHAGLDDKHYVLRVNVPEGVTAIGSKAFADVKCDFSLTLPNSLQEIGDYAFQNCSNLKEVVIPFGVGDFCFDYKFKGCQLSKLVLLGDLCSFYNYDFMLPEGTIYASQQTIQRIKKSWKGAVEEIGCRAVTKQKKIAASYFEIEKSAYVSAVDSVVAYQAYDDTVSIQPDGLYKVQRKAERMITGTSLVDIYYNYNGMIGLSQDTVFYAECSADCSVESGQTYLKFSNIHCTTDETFTPVLVRIYIIRNSNADYGTDVTVDNLRPGNRYTPSIYIYDAQARYMRFEKECTTEGLNLSLAASAGPTSVRLEGSKTLRDARVKREYIVVDGTEYEGHSVLLTGLKPNADMRAYYYVVLEGTGQKVASYRDFKTPALELTTLQPRGVSETTAIVAAKTNMSDEETHAGFQWKKYDAPESLAPSEGYTAIYGGQLEGHLKRLQPTYYKVRAFYKSSAGDYYYGDWVTFDATDFSYFTPTVHTYPVTDVSESGACVRGYMLQGSDDILSQGFEYWASGSHAVKQRAAQIEAVPAAAAAETAALVSAPAASAPAPAAAADGVTLVAATGQMMTAVLTGLQPGTEYHVRAYAETSTGMVYGEEQTFTTPLVDGISAADADARTVTGYYDLSGRRVDAPVRGGVTVVRYSDGTSSKVMAR